MKYNKVKYLGASLAAVAMSLTSCTDSFLDKEPDERVEVSTLTQVTQLLTSGYCNTNYGWICEISSDNMIDNNAPHLPANQTSDNSSRNTEIHYNLQSYERMDDELFRFEQVKSSTGTDSPSQVWEGEYNAIATANQALIYLDNIVKKNGGVETSQMKAARAEALLIRAYHHFILVNLFSQAYKNDEASKNDVGVPYMTEPGTKVSVNYDRGNVADVYAKIEKDLEAGLKDISDINYTQPKWHFNVNAAHAFAAKFYLFKRDYEKVIENADAVLGTGTDKLSSMLMDNSGFDDCTSSTDYRNIWQSDKSNNNLMLLGTNSLSWRRSMGRRYATSGPALTAIAYHIGPNWRWYVIPCNYVNGSTFYSGDSDYGFSSAKIAESFQYSDKVSGIGYCHVIRREFTSSDLLLERAEAKLLKKNPDIAGAEADIIAYDNSRWSFSEANKKTFFANNALHTLTHDELISYYSDTKNYNCFANWDFTQNMSSDFVVSPEVVPYMNCINDMRRYETWLEGPRFFDLKRWGIEYSHIYGLDKKEYKLTWNDPRRAIEIPQEAQAAGLQTSRPTTAADEKQAGSEIRVTVK